MSAEGQTFVDSLPPGKLTEDNTQDKKQSGQYGLIQYIQYLG